ncbi:MAG TPA: SDR family oxidoreductase, partial [Chloroflexota bacterium]|nr:SDR family oxidoreductase [Chloroflexota bacterium]
MSSEVNFRLDDRVAIITGGSTGIGLGIAEAMAAAGVSVVIAARRPDVVDEACQKISTQDGKALGVPTDVSDSDQVQRLIANTRDQLGRIDILVNNAGGTFGPTFKRGPLLEMDDADFEECWAVNVKSAFMCSKAAVPHMMEHGQGSIINISSTGGRENSAPMVGFSAYGSAKAALIGLTRGMAVEWAPRVRANVIAAGMIDTPRVTASRAGDDMSAWLQSIAMGRAGLPQDIAGAAVFLASDASDWMTGSCLDIHGGLKRSVG